MSKTAASWTEELGRKALIVGVGAVGLSAIGIFLAENGKQQFFRSYLLGFIFCLGIPMGCLAIQMIHALTGGRWGTPVRRISYAASTTLPVVAVLFLPLLLGLDSLYAWADAGVVAKDPLLQHKAPYLNKVFFFARAVGCFAIWIALAQLLYKRSVARGLTRTPSSGMRIIAGPGLLIGALTISVAAIDWLMSLDPHWFSTMFAVIVLVGMLLSAMSFLIVMFVYTCEKNGEELPIDSLHDLGNLLLVFVMLWAYVSFSEYFIIYSGNIVEDIPWYVHRTEGGWRYVAMGIMALHFAVPFLVLISRRNKRNPKLLIQIAAGVLVMRLVQIFWVIAPNFDHHFRIHWMDVVLPIGVCGLWLAYFLHRYSQKELVPKRT